VHHTLPSLVSRLLRACPRSAGRQCRASVRGIGTRGEYAPATSPPCQSPSLPICRGTILDGEACALIEYVRATGRWEGEGPLRPCADSHHAWAVPDRVHRPSWRLDAGTGCV